MQPPHLSFFSPTQSTRLHYKPKYKCSTFNKALYSPAVPKSLYPKSWLPAHLLLFARSPPQQQSSCHGPLSVDLFTLQFPGTDFLLGSGSGLISLPSPAAFQSGDQLAGLTAGLFINSSLAGCLCLVHKKSSLKRPVSFPHNRVRIPWYSLSYTSQLLRTLAHLEMD